MTWKVEFTKQAKKYLKKHFNKDQEEDIRGKINDILLENPYKGELLSGAFEGLRSFHCFGNKVRVVYEIINEGEIKVISILVIGWREGFYKKFAQKLKKYKKN